MYSREEKLKAVELFIRYDKSPASVIREIGYPCRLNSSVKRLGRLGSLMDSSSREKSLIQLSKTL